MPPISDDGVSQQIAAKAGITVENITIPNPVKLRPYRTFQELKQPESNFVFRINKDGKCALFEADGGAWRIDARTLVKEALNDALKDVKGIVVIG